MTLYRQFIWRLAPIYFFYYGFLGLFVTYLARLLRETTALSAWQISIVLASTVSTALIVPLVIKFCMRRIATLTQVRLNSIGLLLCYLSAQWLSEFYSLWLAYTLAGFFLSLMLPAIETLTLQALPLSSGVYGKVRLWGSLGFMLCVMICGYWIDHFPIHWLAGLGVLYCLAIWAASYALPVQTDTHTPAPSASPSDPAPQGRRRTTLYWVLFITWLWQVSMAPGHYFLDSLLAYKGYSGYSIGLLVAWGTFSQVVLFYWLDRLIKRFGYYPLLLFSLTLTLIRWLLTIAFSGVTEIMILAQTLHAFAFGANHGLLIYLIFSLCPPHQRLLGQGLFVALGEGCGLLIGCLLAGWLWQYHPLLAFIAAALCTALAWLIVRVKLLHRHTYQSA